MKHALLLILIFISLTSNAEEITKCGYVQKSDEYKFGKTVFKDNCGVITNEGKLKLHNEHLLNIDFSQVQYSCIVVFTSKGLTEYFVNKSGKSISTVPFDGCDRFSAGFARTEINGKIAFFNKNLDVVIKTDFNMAEPFYFKHSVVCNGQPSEIKKHEHEHEHEHGRRMSGKCGLINKKGELVIEPLYEIGDHKVFKIYIASHNECKPPPVESKEDALCHAKIAVKHMGIPGTVTNVTKWLDVTKEPGKEGNWIVKYIEDEIYITTMVILKETAWWQSTVTDKIN